MRCSCMNYWHGLFLKHLQRAQNNVRFVLRFRLVGATLECFWKAGLSNIKCHHSTFFTDKQKSAVLDCRERGETTSALEQMLPLDECA